MSNKSRLETNNTNLRSVLQAVQGLPKYVKPEGMYVWKKYQYTPPTYVTSIHNSPSIQLSIYSGSGNTSSVVCFYKTAIDSTISLDEIPAFLDGYSFVDGNNVPYTFTTAHDGSLELNGKMIQIGENDYYWLFNYKMYFPANHKITMTYPSTTKNVRKISTPVFRKFESFVTGNVSNAYPNNGPQEEYWYEKIGDITPLMFGYEKIAIDTVTLSENKTIISHSLGAVPKIIIFAADTLVEAGSIYGMVSGLPNADDTNGFIITFSSVSVPRYDSYSMIVTVTDSDFTLPTGKTLTAGLTYSIITMA